MEAIRYLDPGYWQDDRPDAPGRAFPCVAEDRMGLVWFQTSGTMGEPHWIGLSRESLLLSATVVNRHLGVRDDEVWGLVLPLHHVGGFGVVARAYESGARLAVGPQAWDARAFTAWVERERVNHLSLVPTQVHDLIAARCVAPECVLTVVVGGGHFPESMRREARVLGWPVLASYGMTECGSQVATQRVGDAGHDNDWLPVLPHWKVRVGEAGVLEVRGESLYVATLERADDGGWFWLPREAAWHQTRDVVELAGNDLRVIGRADRRVKVLGELVDLEAIERKFPAGRVAVVALPDARRGARLVLFYEGEAIDVDAYQAQVDGPWRVSQTIALRELPRSDLGKIRYAVLMQMLDEGFPAIAGR